MEATERNGSRKHTSIELTDFGPLVKGTVTLRPLRVFAGHSNTGKSWIATLIYDFLNYYSSMDLRVNYSRYIFNDMFNGDPSELIKMKPPLPENSTAWIDSIKHDRSIQFTAKEITFLESIFQDSLSSFEVEMQRCFGIYNSSDFVREGSKNNFSSINFHSHSGGNFLWSLGEKSLLSVNFSNVLSVPTKAISKKDKERFLNNLNLLANRKNNGAFTEQQLEHIFFRMHDFDHMFHGIFDSHFGPVSNASVWYLPADRGGVMHAHRAVVSALVQHASFGALRHQSPIPVLSGVLTDFLENLISFSGKSDQYPRNYIHRRQSIDGHVFAKKIEEKILNGSVAIEDGDVNYPHFSWTPMGWNRSLPLLNVSSMVSELVPVALYLRHVVQPGDLLILEEPEAHIHPAKQVALTREVARWVRGGIQVILTTHSEWLLEALSNLLGGEALNKDQVGLWQFELVEGGGGSTIREVEWDGDEGGFATGYEDVATDLHNEWVGRVGGAT